MLAPKEIAKDLMGFCFCLSASINNNSTELLKSCHFSVLFHSVYIIKMSRDSVNSGRRSDPQYYGIMRAITVETPSEKFEGMGNWVISSAFIAFSKTLLLYSFS